MWYWVCSITEPSDSSTRATVAHTCGPTAMGSMYESDHPCAVQGRSRLASELDEVRKAVQEGSAAAASAARAAPQNFFHASLALTSVLRAWAASHASKLLCLLACPPHRDADSIGRLCKGGEEGLGGRQISGVPCRGKLGLVLQWRLIASAGHKLAWASLGCTSRV